jgi:MFS family permease
VSDEPTPRLRRLPLLRRLFDDAYLTADRMLDRGQRHAFRWLWFFLPETSVARDLRFQQIAASRFFSDAGQQALAYGALIIVARNGGSALDLALIGMAALLPAALLGLYGGEVADALPRRVALAGIYNLQALFCFLVPFVAGTDIWSLFALILAVNALGQVSGPTESAVLPLVATEQQLASATSLVHFASSAGTAFGTALLAPILVVVLGERSVMYVAGALLIVAATRVFDLSTSEPPRQVRLARPSARLLPALRTLTAQPAVSTMLFVAVLSGTANIVLQTLAPRYVVAALHVDAANAVYVFAPSAAGLLLAVALGASIMKLWGERVSALLGFLITTTDLLLLGLVDRVTDVVDPVNPVHALSLLGIDLNAELRTAALLALPLGFSVALTTTSVQTYLNRRVPLAFQGRTFAIQSTLKNGIAIVPLLSLGAAASAFGVEPVLIASPIVLFALAYALVQLSIGFAGISPAANLEVFSTFWHEAPQQPAEAPP